MLARRWLQGLHGLLNASRPRARARGFSIVERLVGVAIGRIVTSSTVVLSSRRLASSRQLLAEIRANQDLRAVAGAVTYAFTRDAAENNVLDGGEQFGFRLHSGRVEMQTAQGVWQAVTDPDVLTITAFTITPVTTTLALGHLCPTT